MAPQLTHFRRPYSLAFRSPPSPSLLAGGTADRQEHPLVAPQLTHL